jgi:hypothetical protein
VFAKDRQEIAARRFEGITVMLFARDPDKGSLRLLPGAKKNKRTDGGTSELVFRQVPGEVIYSEFGMTGKVVGTLRGMNYNRSEAGSCGFRGWPLKPTAFHPAIGLERTLDVLLLLALALVPCRAFAQRGPAGGHAAGGHAAAAGGGIAAPRAPVHIPAAVSRPASASAGVIRPIIGRPTTINPVTSFRTPVRGSEVFFASRPPLRFPVRPFGPYLGTAGLFGLGYNPFLFSGCNPSFGFGYGCVGLAPYSWYGVGYFPPTYPSGNGYPSTPDYPSDPSYPSGPAYNPPDPSATLQYTPLLNQYPSLEDSTEDLGVSRKVSAQLRNEVILYLKDGSVFAVASYTVSNGLLHYVTAYGEKNDVSADRLDLHKTIEANAARGVAFTLTPSTDPSATQPSPLGPAPAPPGPITPPRQ